jgi:hypothetical protein
LDDPHTDTTWPFVARGRQPNDGRFTEEQRYKVLRRNAIRMLELDRV